MEASIGASAIVGAPGCGSRFASEACRAVLGDVTHVGTDLCKPAQNRGRTWLKNSHDSLETRMVEPSATRIVIPVVVGSNPIVHPTDSLETFPVARLTLQGVLSGKL